MNVLYKCRCMAEEAVVAVEDRSDDENVVEWIERTAAVAIASDHQKRSPLCRSTVMEYLKVETQEGQPIGRLTRQ